MPWTVAAGLLVAGGCEGEVRQGTTAGATTSTTSAGLGPGAGGAGGATSDGGGVPGTGGFTSASGGSGGGVPGTGGTSSVGGMGQGGSSPCASDCSALSTPDCLDAVCNEGRFPGTVGECIVVPAPDGTPCNNGSMTCDDGTCK